MDKPPSEQLLTTRLQILDDDPPLHEITSSLDDVREAVARLRDRKALDTFSISTELLRAGGTAMIRGTHAV